MLNEKRVILMTKMASYEENEGKRNMEIARYFRSDYIAVQILKSVFCATIAYALIFALYIFYDLEIFLQDIYSIDLVEFGKKIFLNYAYFVIVYGVITYLLSTYRYVRAKKSLRLYYRNLKKLNSMYHEG